MSTASQSNAPAGDPAAAHETLDNPAAAAPPAPFQAPAQGPMEELAAATAAFAETFHRWSSRKAIEAGANVTRLRLLHLVSCHGPQKMAELAGRLDVTPRSVTALVDGLETEGLVRRTHHATDRRVLLVELTCNPDRVQSQMLTYQASLARLLAELSETEREVMLRALVRLRDSMHAETMVPAPRQIRGA
jgi:DNA-binding MarR family transcriptional regulator